METGLPTKEVFDIGVNYTHRYKDSTSYFHGWKAESIKFEDQIFTLIKLKQNNTNLHLAKLFPCSVSTAANIVIFFVQSPVSAINNVLFFSILSTFLSKVVVLSPFFLSTFFMLTFFFLSNFLLSNFFLSPFFVHNNHRLR